MNENSYWLRNYGENEKYIGERQPIKPRKVVFL